MRKCEIPTPALTVDLDKLHQNIDEMAERARSAGMTLRPHIKTHKTPIIAHLQVRAGAVGIACAKLGEAEVMAAAGIEDIFVAYPIVGRDKIERLLNLARWVPQVSTSVDTLEAARALNEAAVRCGQHVDILVEIEAGHNRTGVPSREQVLTLVREIASSMPALRFKGLMYIAGMTLEQLNEERVMSDELEGAKIATDAASLLRANGIAVERISGGTTPGARYMHLLEGVTEYRAGCYVFGDMKYADLGAHSRERMALTILTTVVSIPDLPVPPHFVVDAGSKVLTHSAALTTPGYGTLVGHSNLFVSVASEEHGVVRLPQGVRPPSIGTKLEIYPNYVSDVVNTSDELWIVKDGDVVATWKVLARGLCV